MTAIKPIKNNPIITVMDKVCKNHKPFYMEKLTDSFYRGSEPGVKQIEELGKMGIKTILNLKSIDNKQLSSLSQLAEKNGMKYVNIPLNPFHINNSFPHILDVIKSGTKDKCFVFWLPRRGNFEKETSRSFGSYPVAHV